MLQVFDYIGTKLRQQNAYVQKHHVNCIKTSDGVVIANFAGKGERTYAGISDLDGTAFYIRIESTVEYGEGRRLTSSAPSSRLTAKFRVVLYCVNQSVKIDPVATARKIADDLGRISFRDYAGAETNLSVRVLKTTHDATTTFKEETGVTVESDDAMQAVAIDARLQFSATSEYCEEFCATLARVDADCPVETVESSDCIPFSGVDDDGPPYPNSLIEP